MDNLLMISDYTPFIVAGLILLAMGTVLSLVILVSYIANSIKERFRK